MVTPPDDHGIEPNTEIDIEDIDRPCNRKGCARTTPSGAHAYCSAWHELFDLLTGNLLYEGIRDD